MQQSKPNWTDTISEEAIYAKLKSFGYLDIGLKVTAGLAFQLNKKNTLFNANYASNYDIIHPHML